MKDTQTIQTITDRHDNLFLNRQDLALFLSMEAEKSDDEVSTYIRNLRDRLLMMGQ